MFELGSLELLVIAIIVLIVVGPRDLPRLMRSVGHFVGKARTTARHFKSSLDTMVREAELEDMQKKWNAHNAAVMRGDAASGDGGEAAADGQGPAASDPVEPKPDTR